jgi:hypothetical protein
MIIAKYAKIHPLDFCPLISYYNDRVLFSQPSDVYEAISSQQDTL